MDKSLRKVCRSADLQKGCTQASKSLDQIPCAIDNLTALSLKVLKFVIVEMGIGAKQQFV